MENDIASSDPRKVNITLRVTALWAFSESFLGGVLHGLKMPFSGLFLAFIASVCITIIAGGTKSAGEIMKATILVMVIKFILSPHTPIPAYLAVFVQGLAGELFFLINRQNKVAAFLHTIFSLTYSAFQHLFILTIIYGTKFWIAIDIFLNKISQIFIKDSHNYSLYIVWFYLGCYILAGIIGGFMNVAILEKIKDKDKIKSILPVLKNYRADKNFIPIKKAKNQKYTFLFVGIIVFALLIFSYSPFFQQTFLKNYLIEIFIRASLIFLVFRYFAKPIIYYFMENWISKYRLKKQSAIAQAISLMPDIKNILSISWQHSKHKNKFVHLKYFVQNSILLIVAYE